tara:strand:- start:38419 stop:38532 length:114 start_codon:yes stop_codon:yes gene_type:complete
VGIFGPYQLWAHSLKGGAISEPWGMMGKVGKMVFLGL